MTIVVIFRIEVVAVCVGEAEPSLEGSYVCCVLNDDGEVIAAEGRNLSMDVQLEQSESPKGSVDGTNSVPLTPKPDTDSRRRRSG